MAAFDAGESLTAYVESVAVNAALPDTPLFLGPGWHVNVPFDETYQASWEVTPGPIRGLLESPAIEPRPPT